MDSILLKIRIRVFLFILFLIIIIFSKWFLNIEMGQKMMYCTVYSMIWQTLVDELSRWREQTNWILVCDSDEMPDLRVDILVGYKT